MVSSYGLIHAQSLLYCMKFCLQLFTLNSNPRFPTEIRLANSMPGCTYLCRLCLTPQKECRLINDPHSQNHAWPYFDTPAAEIFRQFILDFYELKCATYPNGKIPHCDEAQARAEMEQGLKVMSRNTYQQFGMSIILTFRRPKKFATQPAQPKSSQ